MTASESTIAFTPPPAPAATEPMGTTFSYLDVAGLIVHDWRLAHPEDTRNAEEVADAIVGSFSVEQLHALVLAHLQA